MTRYGRIGGLDDYLTKRFVNCDPATFAAALKRLRMAWEHAADLTAASPPEPGCQRRQGAGARRCAAGWPAVLLPSRCCAHSCCGQCLRLYEDAVPGLECVAWSLDDSCFLSVWCGCTSQIVLFTTMGRAPARLRTSHAALTCDCRSVIEHLKARMRQLPFSPHALSSLDHVASAGNCLEFVLRDVPLCAREIDVCCALAAWAGADDGYSSDEGEGPEERLLGVDERLLAQIDLTALSPEDLCKVRQPVRLWLKNHARCSRDYDSSKAGLRRLAHSA